MGYFFELYNSYTLFYLSFRPDATWQIPCLSLVFAFLGVGNIVTTSWTIPSKIGERHKGLLKLRFTRLDKYFWSHKKKFDEVDGPEVKSAREGELRLGKLFSDGFSGKRLRLSAQLQHVH